MSRPFRIVCRGSWLSLAQAALFKGRLLQYSPEAKVEVIIKETRGDANQNIPLQEIEGKDFFTKDIQDYLLSGQADFAIHSLKDVSGEKFFSGTHFAILEREDAHDVAVFNDTIVDQLAAGLTISIGTSSPRRAEMAIRFLRTALPNTRPEPIRINPSSIRGNVDTRLRKLSAGEFDGIILAVAGLNRLLKSAFKDEVKMLLRDKKKMILPLLDCPPAPGQGAIVIETTPDNVEAVKVLQSLNDTALAGAAELERRVAHLYGSGCHQKFGVVHIQSGDKTFVRAFGKDRSDQDFEQNYGNDGTPWTGALESEIPDPSDPLLLQQGIFLVSEAASFSPLKGMRLLQEKRVWVAETRNWPQLAKQGTWVEGSLEGFGLEFNERTLKSPVLQEERYN